MKRAGKSAVSPSDTITRAQARKLVEQALRSQEDPGEYTPQQMFGGQYEDNTQWKARALDLVMSRMADEPPAIQMSAETVDKVREALLEAKTALERSYDVLEYPATPSCAQSVALTSCAAAISLLPVTPRQAP